MGLNIFGKIHPDSKRNLNNRVSGDHRRSETPALYQDRQNPYSQELFGE